MATNDVRARASIKDEMSGPLDRLSDKWKVLGAKGVAMGVGMAATNLAFQAASRAIGKVAGVVGEASDAYIQDERSQALLRTSLYANVAAFEGNTAAIEDRIFAGQRLGFSDDEQRESLTKLVGVTKDETKALEVQRTAMDLARMRGMSLADATELLGKVAGGNVSILRRYGIAIEKGASSTEALAAIQKMAQGQASTFADTIDGRLTRATIRQQEALEGGGKTASRVQLIWEEAWAGIAEGADNWLGSIDKQTAAIEHFRSQGLNPTMDELRAYMDTQGEFVFENERMVGSLKKTEESLGDVTASFRHGAAKGGSLITVLRDLGYEAGDADKATGDLASTLSEALFGDAINEGNLAELRETAKGLRAQRDAAKEGSREYNILTGRIAENERAQFDLQLQMAEKTGPAAVLAFLDKARDKYGTNNTRLQTMIDKLRTVWSLLNKFDDVGVITFGRYDGKLIPGFHAGGRPTPGEPAIVGEKGPELFVPDTAGTIVPNNRLGSGSMGGSTVVNINVSTPALTPGGAEALARYLEPIITRAQQRRGIVARVA